MTFVLIKDQKDNFNANKKMEKVKFNEKINFNQKS